MHSITIIIAIIHISIVRRIVFLHFLDEWTEETKRIYKEDGGIWTELDWTCTGLVESIDIFHLSRLRCLESLARAMINNTWYFIDVE
jgi:hypothetical protein